MSDTSITRHSDLSHYVSDCIGIWVLCAMICYQWVKTVCVCRSSVTN